jgi:hypothetical protein
VPGHPFIGSKGEQGGRTGKGIGRPVVLHHYWPYGSVGRGNGGGEWGVKRGECGAIFGRGGDAGAARALEEKEAGWGPRSGERRGWSHAGLVGGQGLVGREAGGWAWEKDATQGRRRGSGLGRRERSGPGRGDRERAG